MSPHPRILILGAGPLCRNPRVLKEATALAAAGFDVTVTSIMYAEKFEAYDRAILATAPFRMRTLDRLGRDAGSRLSLFADRVLGWLARTAIPLGIQSRCALGPFNALLRLARSIPSDLVIVHTELPFCVGAELLRRGRRVAADFEDWHSRDLLPAARAHRPLRLLAATERQLLREAAFCTAPSGAMAAGLQQAYGGPLPVVLPNTFPLQTQPAPLPRQSPPSFFWFSQTIGPGRGIEAFLSAWGLMKFPSRIVLLGDIASDYRASLIALVPAGRRGDLSFIDIVSPDELPSVIARHDIGLALEPETPESRYLTITNKIFQYLNAGLAVLATPTAGQREVLAEVPNCGLLVSTDDPQALAILLDGLISEPGRLAAMGAAARAGATDTFCWERAAPRLVETVRAALAGGRAGP